MVSTGEPSTAQESLTLAEVKRRAREEVEDDQDDYGRRYRTLNFTSEDSRTVAETQIGSYYCSVCGVHNLILEGDLRSLPSFEKTFVLKIGDVFHKSYMNQSDVVHIRRPQGVESRSILRCRECDFPLGYRVKDKDHESMTQFLYLFHDGFVGKQYQAETFSGISASSALNTTLPSKQTSS